MTADSGNLTPSEYADDLEETPDRDAPGSDVAEPEHLRQSETPLDAIAERRSWAVDAAREGERETLLLEALGFLADVPLQVEIRLGGTRLAIGELLQLTPGAVVALERRADDPVEIVAAGQVIARGEMVVVDNGLGVRITELCRPGGEAGE